MSLDINRGNGPETARQEQKMFDLIRDFFPKSLGNIVETPKYKPAAYDGFIYDKNNVMTHIFESKCRKMTFNQMETWGNTWLITLNKLKECAEVSRLSQVPMLGFLYLIPEQTCIMWEITNSVGGFKFDFKSKKEETQATCNGGKANRVNAHLPYKCASLQISYKRGIELLPGHKDYEKQ